MYEFHGWISCLSKRATKSVQTRLKTLDNVNVLINHGYCNGTYIANLSGCHNHDRNSEELLDLFTSVAQTTSDAMGMLHLFDGEHEDIRRAFMLQAGSLQKVDGLNELGMGLHQ